MKAPISPYHRHRFPPEIIQHTVWLYHQFSLSFRDIEDLLAERGIQVPYETIRHWCIKFGPKYASRLRKRSCGYSDTCYPDEVFVRIDGQQRYLYRAVDQDGDVIDILVQKKRDACAAKTFFRRLVKRHGGTPRVLVTDKLRSYPLAVKDVLPDSIHVTEQYANNRAERSHQSTRRRNGECGDSNQSPSRSYFFQFTPRYKIYSILGAICLPPRTIEFSGYGRLHLGRS